MSGYEGRGSGRLVLPVRRQHPPCLVVPRYSVDATLHQDESELGVLVFLVLLQVLANVDGFLDQEVQVFREVWSQAFGLQNPQNLVPRDGLHLSHPVAISEDDSDLRGVHPLLRQPVDVLLHFFGGHFQPVGDGAAVGDGRGGDPLTRSVHATHLVQIYANYQHIIIQVITP